MAAVLRYSRYTLQGTRHGLCRKVSGLCSTWVVQEGIGHVQYTGCLLLWLLYNYHYGTCSVCHNMCLHLQCAVREDPLLPCPVWPLYSTAPPPRPPPALLSGIEDPNPFFKWLMGKPFAQNVIWGPHFYAQVNVVTLLPCCSSMVHLESHQKLHCDCVVYHGTLATANLR